MKIMPHQFDLSVSPLTPSFKRGFSFGALTGAVDPSSGMPLECGGLPQSFRDTRSVLGGCAGYLYRRLARPERTGGAPLTLAQLWSQGGTRSSRRPQGPLAGSGRDPHVHRRALPNRHGIRGQDGPVLET